MERVIIESPFAGDVPENILYARNCISHSLRNNEAPLASHLLYTQPGILDDLLPEERERGMKAGWAWLKWANIVAFYIDRGISKGMLGSLKEVIKIRNESITNYPRIEVRSIRTDEVLVMSLLTNQAAEESLRLSAKELIASVEQPASSER